MSIKLSQVKKKMCKLSIEVYSNNSLSVLLHVSFSTHHSMTKKHLTEDWKYLTINVLAYFPVKNRYFLWNTDTSPLYSLCSYTFPLNKMFGLQIFRFNCTFNHSHLSRNRKKVRDLTLKSRRCWTFVSWNSAK